EYGNSLPHQITIGPGPRVSASYQVHYLPCGKGPLYLALVLPQRRGITRLPRLRHRLQRMVTQTIQGLRQKRGANPRKPERQGIRIIFLPYFRFLLNQYITGIETFIHKHRSNTRFYFSIYDRPLDRGGPPVVREKRSMHINASKRRKPQERRRNNLSVS